MQRILQMERKDSKIRAWFWVASILLLSSYLVTLFYNKYLLKAQKGIEHTYVVIVDLESLFSAVKDAETGVRGYTISKDTQFLAPYYTGIAAADSLQKELKELTKGSNEQAANMDSLSYWVKERLDMVTYGLNTFNSNNQTRTPELVVARPRALFLMNRVRSYISKMKAMEYELLRERTAEARRINKFLDVFTFTSIALALGILSFAFITYRREHAGRKKAYNEISAFQEQLKKQVIDLDAANRELVKMRAQEKFAASGRIARQIAHEVRNPLTNINLATNQLKEDQPNPNEDTLYLYDMIARNSERINNLISELLNSTKFQDLNFSEVEVTEVLEDALEMAADRISLSKVKVVKDYHEVKPIMADEEKLKIAFLNLMVNAIEAMEEQEDGTLTLETTMDNGRIKVNIGDNGRGVNEESLGKMFEPYFTTKQKGNGLGLTNTQNIILNHKGEISVNSMLGSGTVFTILLD